MGAAICAQQSDEPLSHIAPPPMATSFPPHRRSAPPHQRTGTSTGSVSSASSSIEAYAVMREVVRSAVQTTATVRGHSSSQGTTHSSSHQNRVRSLPKKTTAAVPPTGSIMVPSMSSPSASSQDHTAATAAVAAHPLQTASCPASGTSREKGFRAWGNGSGGKKTEDALRQWLEAQASIAHLSGAIDTTP
jgi:hypothetical protein